MALSVFGGMAFTARAAYDALNDAQKTFVENYETLEIAEGQYAALQLAADMAAFEAYKTEKKNAMDALAEEGDSEAVLQIIGLAKTQIDYASFDESKMLDENKAVIDDLVKGAPAAVAAQRAADANIDISFRLLIFIIIISFTSHIKLWTQPS